MHVEWRERSEQDDECLEPASLEVRAILTAAYLVSRWYIPK